MSCAAPPLPPLVARLVHAAGDPAAVLVPDALVVPRAQRRHQDGVRGRAVAAPGRLLEEPLAADTGEDLVQDGLRRLLLLEHPDLHADALGGTGEV